MADEKVLYEVKDKIMWITLNRPESLNAVNREMVKSIVEYGPYPSSSDDS
jgi:enoyl-CoA hydratase/carnithine racemase